MPDAIAPHPLVVFREGLKEAYPGGQFAASREGRLLVSAAAGHLAPGAAETCIPTIYDLASLTKPLATAVLVGRALELGLCALNDPLSRFIDDAPDEVTLEHALEHSTGYPAHLRFDEMLDDLPLGTWDAYRQIVQRAATTPRERPVGHSAVYSDVGFILLGAAIEQMYGRPISAAFAELGTSLFYLDRRGPPASPFILPNQRIAPTEACEPGEVHDENCRAMGGAAGHAGLWGTAVGVLSIAESLVAAYHGEADQLLQPDTVRRLWRPSLVPDSTRTLGWDRPSGQGSSTGGQWPSHSVGHLGFTGTSVWIEPERALIAVLVTNRVHPTRDNTKIRQLRPALHDAVWSAWA
ncbi:MAG: serine hydrolase domain-containing protein [Myxococcota bacterium]